jgi:hypothetical protein
MRVKHSEFGGFSGVNDMLFCWKIFINQKIFLIEKFEKFLGIFWENF